MTEHKSIEEYIPVFNEWELGKGDFVEIEEGVLGGGKKVYRGNVVAWEFEDQKCQHIELENGRKIDYIGMNSWLHVRKLKPIPQLEHKSIEDCPFCEMFKKTDKDVIDIEPLNPVTKGHRLVISREHTMDFTDNPELFAKTAKHASELAKKLGGDYNLITSKGSNATQTVFHTHIHLVPRSKDDGLTLPWTYINKITEDTPHLNSRNLLERFVNLLVMRIDEFEISGVDYYKFTEGLNKLEDEFIEKELEK